MFESITYLGFFALLTIVLEAFPILYGFRNTSYKLLPLIFVSINIVTNVILNALIIYFQLDYGAAIVGMEVVVFIVEAAVYRFFISDLSLRRILVVTYIANTFSFIAGMGIVDLIAKFL
ncbi:hypothetical protein [Butyrivibrio proteoclasticus]|uniref:hypothetical protein n=1 Tax=Butyrivibrio proteoclasticus TaxID=43305 RepID=UPI00047A9C62|nr:hypothetical protein [Butyrivibrio proteoclasticus]